MAIPKNLTVGLFSTILGFAIALANMLEWSSIQNSIEGTRAASMVLGFYAAQALSTGLVLLGLYSIYRFLAVPRTLPPGATTKSVVDVLGDALLSKRAFKIGSTVAILYAVLYAFFSSLIVYQPTVNFAQIYGAATTSWTYLPCCGDTGTIPTLTVYLAPSLHIGMVLVPLTLLFFFLVPVLVGFNATISYYAFKLASAPLTGRWFAASGAMVGLFTACPTCAGLFLASSLGGVGTALAVGLAPYQLLFVAVSIPVLLVGPLLTAFSVKRSYEANCRLPPVASPRSKLP